MSTTQKFKFARARILARSIFIIIFFVLCAICSISWAESFNSFLAQRIKSCDTGYEMFRASQRATGVALHISTRHAQPLRDSVRNLESFQKITNSILSDFALMENIGRSAPFISSIADGTQYYQRVGYFQVEIEKARSLLNRAQELVKLGDYERAAHELKYNSPPWFLQPNTVSSTTTIIVDPSGKPVTGIGPQQIPSPWVHLACQKDFEIGVSQACGDLGVIKSRTTPHHGKNAPPLINSDNQSLALQYCDYIFSLYDRLLAKCKDSKSMNDLLTSSYVFNAHDFGETINIYNIQVEKYTFRVPGRNNVNYGFLHTTDHAVFIYMKDHPWNLQMIEELISWLKTGKY